MEAKTHELRIMNGKGDTRVAYRPDVAEEVEAALAQFKELAQKGYLAYAVDAGGEGGRAVREFDPKEERIVMTPAIAGG